jgi:hypothetical protein
MQPFGCGIPSPPYTVSWGKFPLFWSLQGGVAARFLFTLDLAVDISGQRTYTALWIDEDLQISRRDFRYRMREGHRENILAICEK